MRRRAKWAFTWQLLIVVAAIGVMAWVIRQRELSHRGSASHHIGGAEFALAGISSAVIIALVCWMAYLHTARKVLDPLESLTVFVARITGPEPLAAPPRLKGREFNQLVTQLDEFRTRFLDQSASLRRQREALAQRAPILTALQRELAPQDITRVDGLAVASYLMPAEGVLAGDWFHVFPLDGDFVGVVLGDVAGHGAETGIFALQTKQLVISALRLGLDPGKALSWMADHLGETNEQFVTCLVAVINSETGSCRFANAGHPSAMLKSTDSISLLEATGPLVGPYPGSWATGEVILGKDDVLFCYTDGVSEARDALGDELGVEGVIDMLARAPSDANLLLEFFVEEIHDRAVNVSDDLTMLAIQRVPQGGP